MRIKQLKLSGFKSFVEPAELRIESGLTGIVGPNGCGKSNLLEAIRWVMGEASAKSLRGGGMEDVIFAGTESRPSRDFAEVTIRADRDAHDAAAGYASNDDDPELEVTRRIERGAGSAYRVNGRDVRAKDVALIFADAATGAHSPALVSQGRIGSIIAAKPQERRQMLEEAAGISGLHVRRKDAEQKLRAAETNLNRLATILADMDARAGNLRRQAKQAERYRKLTTQITQAEARLIFVRWKEAKSAADAAKAEAALASAAVDKAAAAQQELSTQHQSAIKTVADDRAAAMMTRDAANDLSNKHIQLSGERDRVTQRQADLHAQAGRMADDGAREGKLTHDAADALRRLQDESTRLSTEIKAIEDERPALVRATEHAERQSRESEVTLAKAMAEQARAEAERRVADAALANAQTRLHRARRDMERLTAEQGALGNAAELQTGRANASRAVDGLQNHIGKSAIAIDAAEARRAKLLQVRDTVQSAAAAAKAELAALTSEHSAIERALAPQRGNKAIDQIVVEPGYERALAAALGDDANAAIGGASGRRWNLAASGTQDPDPPIPYTFTGKRLSAAVIAPPELAVRLAMVRVVEADHGEVLAAGERLVTMQGELRRWDGFAADNDGAVLADRLMRTNRLNELGELLSAAHNGVADTAMRLEQASIDIAVANEVLQHQSRILQSAEGELRQALRDADKAEDALTRLKAATEALNERRAAADAELSQADSEVNAAAAQCAALPDGHHHQDLTQKLAIEGENVRRNLMQTQADLSALDQRMGQQRERRAVALAEVRSWQERAGEAERRIAEMNKRESDIVAELESIADRPDELRREISVTQEARRQVAEKLAALQFAEQASEARLKQLEAQLAIAAETLSSARELRAGAEARAENQELRRVEMGRVSGERFECPPPVLPEKLGFDEQELDETSAESARLDRLQLDRERIGPVNLIAADELTLLETDQEKGQTESAELAEAINRLRGSIGSLNREGRQRLLSAFEAVDGHFRRLFTTLFSGGQAHLELIDSDDPLEAGLEIMAQPPGKKLSSLTLLSGGEQALTAVALIFGLFLTNPAPICVLDEVDAPLDDANIERFCNLLDVMQRETDTRYLIVTHNAVTMSRMHRLFGVTMVEQGVSRLVSVDLGGAEELLAAE
jgi:chromosome segregation protein